MIKWLKRLWNRETKYPVPPERRKEGLGLHSHAEAIRHHIAQIEKYMALAEDPKLSVGRRAELIGLIQLRQGRLRRLGVSPPVTVSDCAVLLEELDGR